jgi:hypothetical protein
MLEVIAETVSYFQEYIVMDPSLVTRKNMTFKEFRVKVVQKMFSCANFFRIRLCFLVNTLGIQLTHFKVNPKTNFIILNTV